MRAAALCVALLLGSAGARVEAAPPPPKTIVTPDGAPMVLVPAGWSVMGSDTGGKDERPRRRVYLDAFYVDKYPVTNARFRRFAKPSHDFGEGFDDPRQPVVGVTWFQADAYCKSVGKRLPTEAEWEKAERGPDGQTYPWGNRWDPSKVVWTWNSRGRPHPVDRTYLTHESPYGAVDLEGNVWGWAADWYDPRYYRRAPERNPKGPPSGTMRAVRGCSWLSDDPWGFRAAYRHKDPPDYWSHIIGFRCAMPVPPRPAGAPSSSP